MANDTYKIRLTSRALRDLEAIYKYIAETLAESGVALKLVTEIEQTILSLEQFPNRCPVRKVGVYANKNYRQLFVKNYTVIFRVDEAEKTVVIITVRHSTSQF